MLSEDRIKEIESACYTLCPIELANTAFAQEAVKDLLADREELINMANSVFSELGRLREQNDKIFQHGEWASSRIRIIKNQIDSQDAITIPSTVLSRIGAILGEPTNDLPTTTQE